MESTTARLLVGFFSAAPQQELQILFIHSPLCGLGTFAEFHLTKYMNVYSRLLFSFIDPCNYLYTTTMLLCLLNVVL